jgi:hypothetical protein
MPLPPDLIDHSGNHTGDPNGYGYLVHVPYSEEIPTLNEWGLITLLLLLVAAAIIVIRQRRRAAAM